MSIIESIQVAMEAILANRMRSALTMLGIIFGVGAVIAAVSMTKGAAEASMERWEQIGTNKLTIMPRQMMRGPVRAGNVETLTVGDAEAIEELVSKIETVAPMKRSSMQVKAGNQNTNTTIVASIPSYIESEKMTLLDGRVFTEDEVDGRKKLAILGSEVVETLFGEDAAVVGEQIKIQGMSFEVIGQLAEKGSSGFMSPDDTIVIPLDTGIYRLMGSSSRAGGVRDAVSGINVLMASSDDIDSVRSQISTLLRERHGLGDDAEDDFSIMAAADMVESAEASNQIMTLLFGAIAAVSLLVGGIGIMNIMLVSVTERTREIGLRKAVGATPRDIMLQFLIESLTLSLAGGALGVAFGIGMAFALRIFGLNASIAYEWVFVSFFFAACVGVFFGILPSQKAAGLDPVEALRYE